MAPDAPCDIRQTVFSEAELVGRVEAVLKGAGFHPTQASAISKAIVGGERDGCRAHGVYRIDGVLRTIKAGKADPAATPVLSEADSTSIVRVDACGGFSNAAVELGLPLLIERTQAHGIAALVINNCAHFAALWPEIETLAAAGLASMAMCPSYAVVAPTGGSAPLFGTNPFAFGWPRPGTHPYVFDLATSVAARGEIELHRRAGSQLPVGWAIDDQGQPTTDPVAALAGAMLPFGGYKGSAISTMIELLGGILIGDATSSEALRALGTTTLLPTHGELILALSPQSFSRGGHSSGDVLQRAEHLFEAIIGQGARLPSQRRFDARERAAVHGIELTVDEVARIDELLQHGLEAVA
jgi:delta1-piperideine-2-carboxylate reductase